MTLYTVSTDIISASVDGTVCINVPVFESLSAVWPISPTNQSLGDCECPLCDEVDCRFESCHCINDSIYTITLKPDGSDYKLCFNDIMVEMNSTYVHIYYDRIRCDIFHTTQGALLPSSGIYQVYVASHWIIIKGNSTITILKWNC